MKVVYICPGHYSAADGILQKVSKQAQFWSTQGIETTIVTYNQVRTNGITRRLLKLPLPFLRSLLYYVLYTHTINSICREIRPDVIYTRHFLFPFFIYRESKLVLEINGDILAENQSVKGFQKYLISKSIEYYNKHVSAVVKVGDGLGKAFDKVGKQFLIPNSILATSDQVLSQFQRRADSREAIKRNRAVVFMASKNRPHYAIDFIIEFTAKLKDPHYLWLVGDISPKSVSTETIEHVEFFGPQKGKALDLILANAKAAISFLDYECESASPLKTRTYLQYGLPVFGPSVDCDFDGSIPFYYPVNLTKDRSAQFYADELDRFLASDAIYDAMTMTRLPDQIKKVCLDFREMKRVELLRAL